MRWDIIINIATYVKIYIYIFIRMHNLEHSMSVDLRPATQVQVPTWPDGFFQ